jgi:hypothetical protein
MHAVLASCGKQNSERAYRQLGGQYRRKEQAMVSTVQVCSEETVTRSVVRRGGCEVYLGRPAVVVVAM